VNLAQIGEFGAIGLFQKQLSGRSPSALRPDVGIGDDAAVWQPTPGRRALQTTDLLIEEVHFSLLWASCYQVGWKAMAVNISDVAAMGGVPRAAFISCGLPRDASEEALIGLYDGLADCAEEYDVAILGGDTVASPQLVINVAVHGETLDESGAVLRRDAAKPGDSIGLTNPVGGAAGALKLFLDRKEPDPSSQVALLHPHPRVREGQRLLTAGIRCAMDVSDGLVADLGKICAASGVGASVYVNRDSKFVWGSLEDTFGAAVAVRLALTGGEDYELLACGPRQMLLDQGLLIVGEITDGGTVRVFDEGGRELSFGAGGYDAFAGGE
jgi:thiamine-monophosphate kinase